MTVVKIKKLKAINKCIIIRKLKYENDKKRLEESQLENKMNYIEKIKQTQIVLKNHKEFLKSHKSILKTQQRFKGEKHNIFTEKN